MNWKTCIELIVVAGMLGCWSGLFHTCAVAQDETLQTFLQPAPTLELVDVFDAERFPNVVVTPRGTVVLTWGSQQIVAKRSIDGGATFGEPIPVAPRGIQGGGLLVDRANGHLLTFVEAAHPPAEIQVYRSQDDGQSWQPFEATIQPDDQGRMPSMHMNEHGITLQRGEHAGRLIRAARYYAGKNDRSLWPEHFTNAIYSDDHGRTWHTSQPFPENGTGEAALVELADGSLYYNSRVHWDQRPENTRRRAARSRDGGQTWEQWTIVKPLPDGHQHRSYGCMGGLTRLPLAERDILIFSNLDTQQAKRERATVWASFDGGRTWPVKRLVFEGPSAYSSLAAGVPGTATEGWIYLFFESTPGAKVARFNLPWLMAGEPTGDGEIPTSW